MVVNCACPLSSRLVPLAAPIGFSGAFSNVLASVVSAQRFSESDGWRPSKTSAIGLSATPLGSFFLFTKSAIEQSYSHHRRCGKFWTSGRFIKKNWQPLCRAASSVFNGRSRFLSVCFFQYSHIFLVRIDLAKELLEIVHFVEWHDSRLHLVLSCVFETVSCLLRLAYILTKRIRDPGGLRQLIDLKSVRQGNLHFVATREGSFEFVGVMPRLAGIVVSSHFTDHTRADQQQWTSILGIVADTKFMVQDQVFLDVFRI